MRSFVKFIQDSQLELGSMRCLASQKFYCGSKLVEMVEHRARMLETTGVGEGDLVSISRGDSFNTITDLLATWTLGAGGICLDPSLSSFELDNVYNFTQPKVAINDSGFQSVEGRSHGAPRSSPSYSSESPAVILFTSGTTGMPKGVVLSFKALLTRVTLNAQAIGVKNLQRSLVSLPIHFGHGLIGNTLTPLLSGCEVVLPQRSSRLGLDLAALIDDYEINFLTSVPSLWKVALRSPRRPTKNTLRRVHVGSAPLTEDLWHEIVKWAGCEVVNCYGTTETCNWIGGAKSSDGIAAGRVGRPWGGRAAIRDLVSNHVLSHGYGEILVDSPSLMTGYHKRADLTAEVLKDGWYYTGDTGWVNDNGAVTLSGRLKEEINRGGFKIQPAEIDALLEKHPAISEACAFGAPDPVRGEIVCVAIKLRSGASVTSDDLARWCQDRLRRDAIPERWFIMDEIPKNERGKVSRHSLRDTLTTW